MSFIVNYIYDYLKPQESILYAKHDIYHLNENVDTEYSLIDKKYLISKEDLEKINLKPSDNIIPNPSRNMPIMDMVDLRSLNKAQLNLILNVKLKPTPKLEKQTKFEPRHPVLREILQKFSN